MGNLIIKRRQEVNTNKRVNDREAMRTKRAYVKDNDIEEEMLETLTKEQLEDLIELLPYKEALIKIAKGEFEIERIVEEDDEDEEIDEEEVVGGDEDDLEVDEDNFEEDDTYEEDDFEEEITDGNVNDEEINNAWKKRLNGK